MINSSKDMIEACEIVAKKHPSLVQQCAETVATEKQLIAIYRKELREAYALPH
jgi:hypothetical protein